MMEANLNTTLLDLQQGINQLLVSEQLILLNWLIERLQQEPQISRLDSEHVSQEVSKINFEAVHKICDEIRSLPVLDNRSPDEIIGYSKAMTSVKLTCLNLIFEHD